MNDRPAADLYRSLVDDYHLIFEDWDEGIRHQAEVLDRLLRAPGRSGGVDVLDCACGIGTQALGLAARGHRVLASDSSPEMIARARREAAGRGLHIEFAVADMRTLDAFGDDAFDAVLAVDNALPHLQTDDEVRRALGAMASRLRPGGILVVTIRDYDALLAERPAVTPPRFLKGGGPRRIVHQVWEWLDGRRYRVHIYITIEAGDGWRTCHHTGLYPALTRADLGAMAEAAGLAEVAWTMPADSGFYQPILTARRW
jgi:SAM-dependent methyltransferase